MGVCRACRLERFCSAGVVDQLVQAAAYQQQHPCAAALAGRQRAQGLQRLPAVELAELVVRQPQGQEDGLELQ